MDRTIIVPYRAEEKELSQLLYKAIQGLMLVYPPTEDLRKCISEDMFIKPNQQAFFQVMAYLFRILDPQEFKKRFFWPITDKRSESNFRSSTVEYLKYINEKHQLNWTNIKSYLVVMPGGMKFISFLLDFVNFIVHELVKQKERQLNLDASQYRGQISESSLHKICAKNAIFKEMASEFIGTIENLSSKYDEKSQKIVEQLEILFEETGISMDMLCDDKFLEDFEASNKKLFEQQYLERTPQVLEMDGTVKELKEAMDKFFSKETSYKYDKQRLCVHLQRIKDHFPIKELQDDSFGSKFTDEGASINTLISAFNGINEMIQNELKTLNNRPCSGEFVYSRLLALKNDLQEIETQIMEFQKMLNANMRIDKTEYPPTPIRDDLSGSSKNNIQNNLIMKLVSTPPIKLEVPEGGGKSRLALVDVKTANVNETNFNNFLAPPRSNTIRQANRNNSVADQSVTELNISISRSKIIDPMQLLRSTSKKDTSKYKLSTPQGNISSLGENWKLRQTMLLNENEDHKSTISNDFNTPKTQLLTKTASTTILLQSPFTPFSSNDRTRIARSQFNFDSSACDGTGNNNFTTTSLNYIKKPSAVKKVQDASVNLTNLSTSPSGRLEPLVTAEDFNIPEIKLNDLSLIEQNMSINNSMILDTSIVLSQISTDSDVDVNVENNQNVNIENRNDLTEKYEHEEEDALFNISDSVLKDVTL